MKMIKVLQLAVVAMFVLMVITGLVVLVSAPEKMDAYKSLVGTLFGVFLAMVIPALIGSPLTDAVRNISGAKAAQIAAIPQGTPTSAGGGDPGAPGAVAPG